MGKILEISHFLKMICSMSETKKKHICFEKSTLVWGKRYILEKMWVVRDFYPLNLNLDKWIKTKTFTLIFYQSRMIMRVGPFESLKPSEPFEYIWCVSQTYRKSV